MRVLITGATGFVGGRIAARLVAEGHDVTALVRSPSGTLGAAGVEHVMRSLAEVGTDVLAGTEAVVHTAATTTDDLVEARAVNRDGTARVLAAAVDAGVRRFVHLSTAAVYDRPGGAVEIDEDHPLVTPESRVRTYAVTKAEAEGVVRQAAGALATSVLRPSAVLGAGETSTWGTRFPRRWLAGEAPAVHPDATRAWIHVDDLADVVLRALPGDGSHTVNVVAGHTTVGAYLDALRTFLGQLPDPPLAADAPWQGTFATRRLHDELGFVPRRSFADAMAEIARSWEGGEPRRSSGP